MTDVMLVACCSRDIFFYLHNIQWLLLCCSELLQLIWLKLQKPRQCLGRQTGWRSHAKPEMCLPSHALWSCNRIHTQKMLCRNNCVKKIKPLEISLLSSLFYFCIVMDDLVRNKQKRIISIDWHVHPLNMLKSSYHYSLKNI